MCLQVRGQVHVQGNTTYQNRPLSGVRISTFEGKELGFSDSLGFFSVFAPSANTDLLFSSAPLFDVIQKAQPDSFMLVQFIESVLCGPGIVITADYRNLLYPLPNQVLSTKSLQRDDGISITPTLNRVTGLFMHSGTLNTNRITIRGIGSRTAFGTTKIRAYLDDIPLTGGDGETSLEDLDIGLIRQITVWKGPTASLYGAGLGGMIHLRSFEPKGGSLLQNTTTVGSFGLLRNATDLQFANKSETAGIRLQYNTTHLDGYRANNQYDRSGYALITKWNPNDRSETSFFLQSVDMKAFIPSSLSQANFDLNPAMADAGWAAVMGNEDAERLQLGLNQRSLLFTTKNFRIINSTSIFTLNRSNDEVRPFNILKEKSKSKGLRSTFELHKKFGVNDPAFPFFSLGIESFGEEYDWTTSKTLAGGTPGDLLSDNAEKRSYTNIFAQNYFRLERRLHLLIGANLNRTKYTYTDQFTSDTIDLSGQYSYDLIGSPHIGLNWSIQPQIHAFATVSHGFSPPSLAETLTPTGAINPDIQPETGWNFEMGTRGTIKKDIDFQASIYQMEVRNLLVAQRVGPDQYVGQNAGYTRHRGFEADVRTNFKGWLNGFVSYTGTRYRFVEFVNRDQDFSGNPLTGVAPHHVQSGLDFVLPIGFSAMLSHQYVSAYPIKDDNTLQSKAYQLTNFQLKYTKKIGRLFSFEWVGGIQNVFDEHYASMILINATAFGNNAPRYFYPGLPRNYYGRIAIKLSKN